jgi:hypothetical protein
MSKMEVSFAEDRGCIAALSNETNSFSVLVHISLNIYIYMLLL